MWIHSQNWTKKSILSKSIIFHFKKISFTRSFHIMRICAVWRITFVCKMCVYIESNNYIIFVYMVGFNGNCHFNVKCAKHAIQQATHLNRNRSIFCNHVHRFRITFLVFMFFVYDVRLLTAEKKEFVCLSFDHLCKRTFLVNVQRTPSSQ